MDIMEITGKNLRMGYIGQKQCINVEFLENETCFMDMQENILVLRWYKFWSILGMKSHGIYNLDT